jgi:hypothetical protein
LGVGVMRDTDMESITPFLSEGDDGAWNMSVPWKLPAPAECAQREWRLLPAFSVVTEAANDSGETSTCGATAASSEGVQTVDVNIAADATTACSNADSGAAIAASAQTVGNIRRADVPVRFAFNPQPSV